MIKPAVMTTPNKMLSKPTNLLPPFGGNSQVIKMTLRHFEDLIMFMNTKLTPLKIPQFVKNIPKKIKKLVKIVVFLKSIVFTVCYNLLRLDPSVASWDTSTIDEITTQMRACRPIANVIDLFFSPLL
jgi:hypothetical protein